MAEKVKAGLNRVAEPYKPNSPAIRIIVLLSVAIFVVETAIMLLFHFVFLDQPAAVVIFTDGIMLVVALFPFMYFMVLRPLVQQFVERHNAMGAMLESEKRYRSFFENSLVGIFCSTPAGRFTTVNPALVLMLGYDSAAELLAIKLPEDLYVVPAQRDGLWLQCEYSGLAEGAELLWKKKNGRQILVSLHVQASYHADGTTICYEGIVLDVTERRRAVEALREREEQLRTLIDATPDAISFKDGENRWLVANDAALRLFNMSELDYQGKSDLELAELYSTHRQVFQRCQISNETAWQNKIISVTEEVVSQPDGSCKILESIKVPLFYPDGGRKALVVIARDISRRKQAERELREAYQHLQEREVFSETIMANIQSGLIVIDTERRITLANPYVLDLTGNSTEPMVGMPLAEFCPELDAQIAAGVNSAEIKINSCKRDLTIGFNSTDLKRGDGALAGQIITFKDLTEVMKIRREMKLKERLAAIGEVVARVAHEVRNPLFGVTAAAQILAMELQLTPPQKELMNSLLSEARRLNNLVEELLDCSKEMKLNVVIFDLVNTVSETISANEFFVLEKRLTVERRLPHGELTLAADPEKIKQVLLNVVKNAVDATPPGGAITVAVAAEGEGEVAVRVTDSGPGIPEDAMEKIFDIFYTTKKHGTGLGLSISRRIIDAHGGSLTVVNNAGGGATFKLTLPLA